jgi:hypothetical protein
MNLTNEDMTQDIDGNFDSISEPLEQMAITKDDLISPYKKP